jgi:hypothetical protein
MHPMFRTVAVSLLPVLMAAPSAAQGSPDIAARAFPDRSVRMIVPFPPGGPTDLVARIFAQKLSEHWGQPVVVENRAGGNSTIGAQQAAMSAPDGYTLLVAMDTTLVMNPITANDLPYNAAKDFAPISLAAQNTSLLIVRADDGPKTARELIARAKANPGKLNYGAGTITTRLAGYLFSKMAGIDTVFIPYKGSAEVVQAPRHCGRSARIGRYLDVVGARGACGHTGRHRGQDPNCSRQGRGRPRGQCEAQQVRHQCGQHHARGIQQLRAQGARPLVKGLPGERHQARLSGSAAARQGRPRMCSIARQLKVMPDARLRPAW